MHPSPSSPPIDPPVATSGGAMTVSEFCKWASVGRTTLYAQIKLGRIRPRKIGGKTLILRGDAENWLGSLPTADAI
jgi:excisionase family DNA binding protein